METPDFSPDDDKLTPEEEVELAKREADARQPFWHRWRYALAIGLVGGALVVGALAGRATGGGGDGEDPASEDAPATAKPGSMISGSITVRVDADDGTFVDDLQRTRSAFALGAPCDGGSVADGYDDIAPGAGVTVKNEKGEIIATGAVASGRWTSRACVMTFEARSVHTGDRSRPAWCAALLSGRARGARLPGRPRDRRVAGQERGQETPAVHSGTGGRSERRVAARTLTQAPQTAPAGQGGDSHTPRNA